MVGNDFDYYYKVDYDGVWIDDRMVVVDGEVVVSEIVDCCFIFIVLWVDLIR